MRIDFLGILFIVVLLLTACDTSVDLIDEGKETAVVYGFLDPGVDTQFVKITHTFVTEGSAVEAAQDPEQSEYQDLEAYVIAYDNNDSVDSWLLDEKIVTDKDSGAFYYPVQTVYYFTAPLNYDYEYELSFFGSGKEVKSRTRPVGEFIPNNSILFPNFSLVSQFDVNGSVYINKNVALVSSENTRRYEFSYVFNFTEVYADGTKKERKMVFKAGDWITESDIGGEAHEYLIEGEVFFQAIAGKLESEGINDNVVKREIGNVDYIFEYAGEELNSFIELSEPSTSVNVEQNPYTNIENGIGVWSSRGREEFYDKKFTLLSIKELAIGQYTGTYKFCSTDPAHNGTGWGCN